MVAAEVTKQTKETVGDFEVEMMVETTKEMVTLIKQMRGIAIPLLGIFPKGSQASYHSHLIHAHVLHQYRSQ